MAKAKRKRKIVQKLPKAAKKVEQAEVAEVLCFCVNCGRNVPEKEYLLARLLCKRCARAADFAVYGPQKTGMVSGGECMKSVGG